MTLTSLSDTYQYEDVADVVTVSVLTQHCYEDIDLREVFDSVSGWTTANTKSVQPVIKQITTGPEQIILLLTQYRNSGDLNDLTCKVYVNNDRKYAQI